MGSGASFPWVRKWYWVMVHASDQLAAEGTVDMPLPGTGHRREAVPAITRYTLKGSAHGLAWLECEPVTGAPPVSSDRCWQALLCSWYTLCCHRAASRGTLLCGCWLVAPLLQESAWGRVPASAGSLASDNARGGMGGGVAQLKSKENIECPISCCAGLFVVHVY